jgi:hypothetical protein
MRFVMVKAAVLALACTLAQAAGAEIPAPNSGQPITPPAGAGPQCAPGECPNNPPDRWLGQEMYKEMFQMQQAVDDLQSDAIAEGADEVARRSEDLSAKLGEFFETMKLSGIGTPEPKPPATVAEGRPTREDMIVNFYYTIRPPYFDLLRAVRNEQSFTLRSDMRRVTEQYRRLTKCTYGKNGEDPAAPVDDEAFSLEAEI